MTAPNKPAPAKKTAAKTKNPLHSVDGPAKKTVAKKAPAKKAAAKPEVVRDKDHPWYSRSSYKAQSGQKLYEATSESGQISVRSSATPMTHAVSWAEHDRPGSPILRTGRIHTFHADEESAKKLADKLNVPPDRAVVVAARPYKGQGEKG